jgi:hypothetical protein
MDPFSAHAIATARGEDFLREAKESRIAKAARESREDERPAQRPRPVRAGRLGFAG